MRRGRVSPTQRVKVSGRSSDTESNHRNKRKRSGVRRKESRITKLRRARGGVVHVRMHASQVRAAEIKQMAKRVTHERGRCRCKQRRRREVKAATCSSWESKKGQGTTARLAAYIYAKRRAIEWTNGVAGEGGPRVPRPRCTSWQKNLTEKNVRPCGHPSGANLLLILYIVRMSSWKACFLLPK